MVDPFSSVTLNSQESELLTILGSSLRNHGMRPRDSGNWSVREVHENMAIQDPTLTHTINQPPRCLFEDPESGFRCVVESGGRLSNF